MRAAREAIMKAALNLFAQKGYAASSIREICRDAGITKPVLYYYFHNKEHLYQELMVDMFNQTRENLLRVAKYRGSLRERLVRFVSSEFRDCKKHPQSVRLLFRMMFSPEGEYPYFNYVEACQHQRQVIARFLEEDANSGGERRDSQLIATALMGMQLISVLEYMFTKRPTLTRQNAKKLVDLLLSS
jgi:TetR/AcrR family transcriptional regulator